MKNKNKIKLTIITLFISVLVYFFGFQNGKDYILKAALDNIKNPENYSMVQLMNKPSIKKVMEKFNMSKDTFKKYKSNFGITQKKLSKQENFLDKAGVNPVEFKFFINKYPTCIP